MSILGTKSEFLNFESLSVRNLYLSRASDEFDISSLIKISLLEYNECIIKCKSWFTSV